MHTETDPANALPVLVIPGFGEGNRHVEPIAAALCNRGYDSRIVLHEDDVPVQDPVDARAVYILQYLREQPAGQFHVVAHSLGAAAVLRAASSEPERFASLTLMQVPGLSRPQPAYRLVAHAFTKMRHNQQAARNQGSEAVLSVARATVAGVLLTAGRLTHALRDIAAASQYDATDDLQSAARHRIPIHIVTSLHDELFPALEVVEAHPRVAPFITSHTVLTGDAANHDTFWLHPEHTAKLADERIRRLGAAAVQYA